MNWSSLDRNSRHISEMISVGEVSVFLFVTMVDPPREVSLGIDTTSTGCGGVFRRDWMRFLSLGQHLYLEFLDLFERVDMVVLDVEIFWRRDGYRINCFGSGNKDIIIRRSDYVGCFVGVFIDVQR